MKAILEKTKFMVYRQVIGEHGTILKEIGKVDAIDRNDACLQFRSGEFQNEFLTAKKQ